MTCLMCAKRPAIGVNGFGQPLCRVCADALAGRESGGSGGDSR